MPLGTLDRDPPPFFRQGPSALSKLAVCSVLAILLMTADARFKVMQPLRVAVAAVIYPLQWLAMRPVVLVQAGVEIQQVEVAHLGLGYHGFAKTLCTQGYGIVDQTERM